MPENRKQAKPPLGWDQQLVRSTKAHIKHKLDAESAPEYGRSRLQVIKHQLAELQADDSDEGRLKRYVLVMSALVEHERQGGLSASEVEQLVGLAYGILQVQGVKPRLSRLAALYGDIHLIKSQIERKNGEPWQAAWEQQLALQLAGDFPSGGLGFQLMAMGNRSLRLGHAALAEQHFHGALQQDLTADYRTRCQLGLVHALWLSGSGTAADNLAQEILAAEPQGSPVAEEITWYQLVRSCQNSLDLTPLLGAVRPRKSLHQATYIIETCLYGLCVESRAFLTRLPRLGSLARNKNLKPQRLGLWYSSSKLLQDCYDHAVPLPLRLRGLSRALEDRTKLLTVDKELLVLAAATRWLARIKAHEPAMLVLAEYQALSQRLSQGQSTDALGLLHDLTARPWVKTA